MSDVRDHTDYIPLRRSRLPDGDALQPYLREIDANRWYSNFGELSQKFEARIAALHGLDKGLVRCVSSGTMGLELSLRALNVAPGSACLIPSFTFAATPTAALAAGLIPHFVDVDPTSWALTPKIAVASAESLLGRVGAIMPVSPFGSPVDTNRWDEFQSSTGIPVVIDAAWAFDSVHPGRSPSVISLHAVKVLGVGEGGLVITHDDALAEEIARRSNFGFGTDGVAQSTGHNGKISEYAAAVGLAALDLWPETKARALDLAAAYIAAFADVERVRLMPDFGAGWAGAVCAIMFDDPIAELVRLRLQATGIEARRWWGLPCHLHPAFSDYPRGKLDVSNDLAGRVLNLPFYPDLPDFAPERIRDAVVAAQKLETGR